MARQLKGHRNEGDSWYAMRSAWTWFAQPHQGNLYQHIFFERHIKFQYPPSSLLLFKLADLLHINLSNPKLNCVNLAMAFVECAIVGYLAYVGVRTMAGQQRKIAATCAGVVAAFLCFNFDPVRLSVDIGQVQSWLNAWFVIAALCWLKQRRLLAGVFIGAICLFKPQFGLFVLWAALRGERRFLVGWAATVAPIGALALGVFGLANHIDYLAALQFMGRHGEVFYVNQSINGLLARYFGTGNSLVPQLDGFPPFHPVVYLGTLISFLLLTGFCLLYRMRKRPANALDFMIAGLTFTIASPIAWMHHYGILPFGIVLAAIAIAALSSPAKRFGVGFVLLVLWLFAGNYPESYHGPSSGLGTLLQSTMFFANLGLLCLFYALLQVYAERIEPLLEQRSVRAAKSPLIATEAEPIRQ